MFSFHSLNKSENDITSNPHYDSKFHSFCEITFPKHENHHQTKNET